MIAACFTCPRRKGWPWPVLFGQLDYGADAGVHEAVAKCFLQGSELRLAGAVSWRQAFYLVLFMQDSGDTLSFRIRCLDLVQPAEQGTDVNVHRDGLLQICENARAASRAGVLGFAEH